MPFVFLAYWNIGTAIRMRRRRLNCQVSSEPTTTQRHTSSRTTPVVIADNDNEAGSSDGDDDTPTSKSASNNAVDVDVDVVNDGERGGSQLEEHQQIDENSAEITTGNNFPVIKEFPEENRRQNLLKLDATFETQLDDNDDDNVTTGDFDESHNLIENKVIDSSGIVQQSFTDNVDQNSTKNGIGRSSSFSHEIKLKKLMVTNQSGNRRASDTHTDMSKTVGIVNVGADVDAIDEDSALIDTIGETFPMSRIATVSEQPEQNPNGSSPVEAHRVAEPHADAVATVSQSSTVFSQTNEVKQSRYHG